MGQAKSAIHVHQTTQGMEINLPNKDQLTSHFGELKEPCLTLTETCHLLFSILVLSDMVGAIIGRSGGTIRQITQQSRARVDVHRKENAGALEKVITIYGNPENCSSACQKILEVMQTEANTTNRGEIPLKILAHNNLIGRIIGKSGATIKRVMEQTDTKITVSRFVHS
jgi:hypothetical protein